MSFNVSFDTIMTGHQNDNIFVLTRCTAGPRAAPRAHFLPENLHFFTLRLYNPHFLGQTNLTQWGHISPIS